MDSAQMQNQHARMIFRAKGKPANADCCLMLQVMDFGYPQFTEAKILSEYIKTDAHKMEVSNHRERGFPEGLCCTMCASTHSCNSALHRKAVIS